MSTLSLKSYTGNSVRSVIKVADGTGWIVRLTFNDDRSPAEGHVLVERGWKDEFVFWRPDAERPDFLRYDEINSITPGGSENPPNEFLRRLEQTELVT